jgi:hypothetical protein
MRHSDPRGERRSKPPNGGGIPSLTALRCRLRASGFPPLPVNGKAPSPKAWETLTDANDQQIALWERVFPHARSTGILTRDCPAMDIDISIAPAADAVEQLARDRFGEDNRFLVRFGQAPKRAILFQTDTPFPKITANLIAPDGSEHKIEILGNGQQIVAFGIHPGTKRPYSWHGGAPGEFKREDLPRLTEQEARAFVADAVELLTAEHGFTVAAARPKEKVNGQDGQTGGKDDWAWLLSNIRDSRNLHDSDRDLAAKLIRSGMSGGAATNFLRAYFEQSPAPRDARWQERYDDIARAVATAEEKFGGRRNGAPASVAAEAKSEPPRRERFKELFLDDITLDEEQSRALIHGLLPAGPGLSAIVGRPKSLKSFLAMHRGLHIAGGLPYYGREVRQGPAIYITNEGLQGVRQRLVAMKLDLKLEHKNTPFVLIQEMPNLGICPGDYLILKERIDRICQRTGAAPALVDIDTLRRAMPGKDESSSKDMGVLIDNCGKLTQDFNCLVSVNHHSPRSDDTRSSGSNALDAAVDVMWSCVRQGLERKATASLLYMKDGPEDGVAWQIGLRDFPLAGPKGGKFTPNVVDILDGPVAPARPDAERIRRGLPASAKTALRALHQAVDELGTIPPASNHIPPGVRVVTIGQWRDYAYRNGISGGEQRAKEKAFERSFQRLIGSETVIAWNDSVWLPGKQERKKSHE